MPNGSAPRRTSRRHGFGDLAVAGKTVTIAKPSRAELYAFWRDFTNLPAFMENLDAVEDLGQGRWRWTIRAPAGKSVTLVTEVSEDVPDQRIAWHSLEDSDIATEGHVAFRDAPAGRGTYVELEIAYDPPFGNAGRAVAALFQREPALQSRRDLRRFKMLMETGEIATSANRLEEAN